jgi:2-haloacid dehalogenase
MKPAPAIYADMLRKLDLPAERCIYIDDLHENVLAAAGLGLHALHFTGSGRLRAELLSLGILAG